MNALWVKTLYEVDSKHLILFCTIFSFVQHLIILVYYLALILLILSILTETTKVTAASSKKRSIQDNSLVDKKKNPALRTFNCADCKAKFYSEYFLEKHCDLKKHTPQIELGDKNLENPKGKY